MNFLVLKKSLCVSLICAFSFTQVFSPLVAFAEVKKAETPSSPQTFYDLIVLVVDKSLINDVSSYEGLRIKYSGDLKESTIKGRIDRYAEDLRANNSLTNIKILVFDKEKDTTVSLANALTNIYKNSDANANNSLKGVVLIGDVPLPVVNKKGNRFVSMFPYTDFIESAYAYDPNLNSFERNEAVTFPKPEIWHGVIRPSENGIKGTAQLAEFFDKNHLYYTGEPEYADFEKRMFFGDLVHEQEKLNADVYKYYLQYLSSWEDQAYMRYTKAWAKKLSGDVLAELPVDANNPDSVKFAESVKSSDLLNKMPDVYAKNIVGQYLLPYYQVLSNYISLVNDFVDNTGRYDTSEADNVPTLIAIKDEYTKYYLKSVNDALEKAINSVVEKIEEPIPLLKFSKLSGDFIKSVPIEEGEEVTGAKEMSGSMVGGIKTPFTMSVSGNNLPAEYVASPLEDLYIKYHYENEQTKDFYVNGISGDVINTAKQCGYYLGTKNLTKSLRSDNPLTGMPLHTAGVNTRLLSVEEANKLTENQSGTGALVTSNSEYGISAFIDNPNSSPDVGYKNPLSDILQEGDVITKVNGNVLGSSFSFDDSISDAYEQVYKVVKASNNKKLEELDGFKYGIYVFDGKNLSSGGISHAIGNVGLEFYRAGELKKENFTFTVDSNGLTPKADADGGVKVYVLLSKIGYTDGALLSADGGVFTLYDTYSQGFNRDGYDNSAGCNSSSTTKHDERCFPKVALMPALDPAGSVISTLDEDVDKYYYDACFDGLPAISLNGLDSNNFSFPLDTRTYGVGFGEGEISITGDLYGQLLNTIGHFVNDSILAGGNGSDPEKFPVTGFGIWDVVSKLDASQIVLNDAENTQKITLKDFSDRYGIFDGIDNDGDGIRDYEWRDLYLINGGKGQDGIYETKWYDYDEANPEKYGLKSNNVKEIFRKLLSRNSSFTIPAGLLGTLEDATLNVSVGSYNDRFISSMIVHNEPTNYTITEQLKAFNSVDLPIDDPRYVTFMSPPVPLPDYPENDPIYDSSDNTVDVDAYVEKIDKSTPYFPGNIEKIVYPNLFKIPNYAQLEMDLKALATKIALIPGSYKIFGKDAKKTDYSSTEILDEIFKKYLIKAVNGDVDDPVSGFDLETASMEKVYDAFKWRDFNIDEKHEYILSTYLNDAENGFAGDWTLFPSKTGYETFKGYEAAYMVLDGTEETFDMNFNKDLSVEENENFDPLETIETQEEYDERIAKEKKAFGGGDGNGEEEQGFEFVDLSQFLEELKTFISSFTTEPKYEKACASGNSEDSGGGEINDSGANEDSFAKDTGIITYSYFIPEGGTEYVKETDDEIVADGKALMVVEAISDDGADVEFSIESDIPNIVTFEGENVAKSANGVASVMLKAGTKNGSFVLTSKVIGTGEVQKRRLYVVAGEPSMIGIVSDSYALVANGQSKTLVTFVLKDVFGNVANNAYSQIALFADENVYFDESADLNSQMDGIQISVVEGRASAYLYSKDISGDANVIAVLLDYDLEEQVVANGGFTGVDFSKHVGASKKFVILDDVSLNILADKLDVLADGESKIVLGAQLISDGKIVTGYSGDVEFRLLNENFGGFSGELPKKMSSGVVKGISFKASTLAGEPEILINVPGFVSDTIKLKTLPGEAVKIDLTSSSDAVYTNGVEEVTLTARLLDKYGNLVDIDEGTPVTFSLTPATEEYVEFVGAKTSLTLNGIATSSIKGGKISGIANIIASSQNLESGILPLKVTKHLSLDNLSSYSPRVLYLSLLGGAFDNDLLYSGQIQAISGVTTTTEGKKKLGYVDPYGKVEVLSDTVSSGIVPATDSFPYQKIIFSDSISQDEIATMFFVPKTDLSLTLLTDEDFYRITKEGIFVKRVSMSDKKIEFSEKEDGVYIEKNGETKAKIDKFGRIFVNDPNFDLGLPDEKSPTDAFTLSIYDRGEVLANVSIKQTVRTLTGEKRDVGVMPYSSDINSFFPGVYLKMNSSSKKYEFISGFSRSSTDEAKSFYLVDVENSLDPVHKPGFSYKSLESAEKNFGLGFEGDNKHMLLFAGGNSVGESGIPYASEVGIIYGDPTIKVKMTGISSWITTISKFTKTLGSSLFTGKEDPKKMIKFDYNGDSRDDILLAYEEGNVSLLENRISNEKFFDLGNILNISGGIYSISSIDVDNDGYDDLVVGTKESCKVNESCVSLFTNDNGHFKRSTLNLAISGKAVEMKSADLNADSCDDLVVNDSDGNLRIFYNKTDGESCLGLDTNYSYGINVGAVEFNVGNNFADYPKDNYPDLFVRPLTNSNGVLTYLYSNGLDEKGHVKFSKLEVKSDENKKIEVTPYEKDAISSEQGNALKSSFGEDSDYDGCADSWGGKWGGNDGTSKSTATAVADYIQSMTEQLRCSGGSCLPLPFNYAFFAPDGNVPGVALFAAGTPSPPFFSFLYPSNLPSKFRLYISPTLTMGLGTAVCFGPAPVEMACAASPKPEICGSPCFAFAIPPKLFGGCPDFLGPVNEAISKAKNVFADPDVGMSTVVSDGNVSTETSAINDEFLYSDTDIPVSAAGSVNIRIPGFPSVITEWLDKQTDEIFNKLLDLPDFTFIYPDIKTLVSDTSVSLGNFSKVKNVHDFLRAINSLPLVQIESKEVLVKLPALSGAQITKWKRQADAWIKYEEDQLKRIVEYWGCDENEYRKTFCDKITVNMKDLIKSIREMMAKLDYIGNLPRDILTWRTAESKYATKIICYLDAIMQFTGGYITKQRKTVESWMKALEDAIRTFKDWKVILDISAEYQASCDKCKSDRFSKLGMLMQIFAAIPDPPIIPFFKWPDIVFDISQIKTGIKIIWPDLVFEPEPITLPTLPTIEFPDVLPDVVIQVPDILKDFNETFEIPSFLKNFPTFEFPQLPELPDLPLPQLPDLPKPPKIPKLPNAVVTIAKNLKIIFKILCLIKNGLLPIPEGGLATEIETLTQPTVQNVIPFIKNLGVKLPEISYDYVEQIKLDAKIDMGVSTDFIYQVVNNGFEKLNKKTEDFVEDLNDYTNIPWQYILDSYLQKKIRELKSNIEEAAEDASNELESYNLPDEYYLSASEKFIDSSDPLFNKSIDEIDVSAPADYENNQLVALRDSLIAYTQGISDSNELLSKIDDYGEFVKILASLGDESRKIASTNLYLNDEVSTDEKQVSFLGNSAKEKLLASANFMDYAPESYTSQVTTNEVSGKGAGLPVPPGFYVIIGGENNSVLNYTGELSRSIQTLFMDADSDGDTDIIYSMGGDVYLKKNYKVTSNFPLGSGYVISNSSLVSDFDPMFGSSVQGFKSTYQNHKKADIDWVAKVGAASYEIIVRNSLNDSFDDALFTFSTIETNLKLEIENGIYYVNVFAIDSGGNKSLPSETITIAPDVCADKEAPFAAAISSEFNIPIFKEYEIDASGSFDSSGEIEQYYIQFPDSGKVIWGENDGAKFKVEPFKTKEDLGFISAILNVVDQSGNSSQQKIKINIFAPSLSLEKVLENSPVTGEVSPPVSDMPFSLIRERYMYRVIDGRLNLIPTMEKLGKYATDSAGQYEISGFNFDDMVVVQDSIKKVSAEISPVTGNIGGLGSGYYTSVNFAEPPNKPTSIDIFDANGKKVGTVYVIKDSNTDVEISAEEKAFSGISVKDLDFGDKFELQKFNAFNPVYPGGVSIVNVSEKRLVLIIDTSGNIISFDKNLSLRQKKNDYRVDPLVVEVLSVDKPISEVYFGSEISSYIVGPNDVPFSSPRPPTKDIVYGVNGADSAGGLLGNLSSIKPLDTVGNGEIDSMAKDLLLKGIIGEDIYGGVVNGVSKLNLVSRAQFVETLLNMLCIVPRKEAYLPYKSGEGSGGFSDVKNNPYIKEADLLGLIHGYTGEVGTNGLHPFRPDASISRAEVVKIILEALQLKGIITLPNFSAPVSGPWYTDLLKVAQNLTPYANEGYLLKSNNVISETELIGADTYMVWENLVSMITRVLDIYNCFEIDSDDDGMSDVCEKRYGISNPGADQDNDGILNVDECYYGLNPIESDKDDVSAENVDTDFAEDPWVNDLIEKYLTASVGFAFTEGESGIYIVPSECNTCPCDSTFLHKADIMPGDVLFTVISTENDDYIFSKSNEVIVQ